MFPARRRRRSPGACGRLWSLPREGEASCKAHSFTGVTPPGAEQWQGPPPWASLQERGEPAALRGSARPAPIPAPLWVDRGHEVIPWTQCSLTWRRPTNQKCREFCTQDE